MLHLNLVEVDFVLSQVEESRENHGEEPMTIFCIGFIIKGTMEALRWRVWVGVEAYISRWIWKGYSWRNDEYQKAKLNRKYWWGIM